MTTKDTNTNQSSFIPPITAKPAATVTTLKESIGEPLPTEDQINESTKLTWAGKLFFASIAAYIASDVAQAMKLPIKLRGKPEQIRAVVDAITNSKDFQREIGKPGAKIEDVVKKLNLRNMSKERFKALTNQPWPL